MDLRLYVRSHRHISTGPYDCTASFNLPIPEVQDACSATSYTASIDEGILTNANGVLVAHNLEIGHHEITFIARDACGKTSSCSYTVSVEDQIEPTAICDDDLHISIGGDGQSRVYAIDIDEGSHDNCGIATIEVRRQYKRDEQCMEIAPYMGEWREYVDFNCCDVNDTIRIELRVIDQYGNENICWNDVKIEDKSNPYCIAPPAVTEQCDELPYGFDPNDLEQLVQLFGTAEASDNCAGAEIEELPSILNLNDCGFGTLTRRFQAVDRAGNTSNNVCDQVINLIEASHYLIQFPADAEEYCGTPNPDTIVTYELGCDLLAVSVADELFTASEDECYKILRTFSVINWCEYDGEAGPVVISRDEDCDLAAGDEAIWVIVGPSALNYIDRDSIPDNNIPAAGTKGISCDGESNPSGYWKNNITDPSINSVGYWQYTQVIKVYDNTAPEVVFEVPDAFCSVDNNTCEGSVSYEFSITEACSGADYSIEIYLDVASDGIIDASLDTAEVLSGAFPTFHIEGAYPIGQYTYEVHVRDGCGNSSIQLLPFEVSDCKAPSPVCIDGLSVELMPVEGGEDVDGDGIADLAAMTIWAEDYIASANEDCSGPVEYSIHRIGEAPNPEQNSLTVTCADIGEIELAIYAWDSSFNPYAIQPDGTIGGPNYDHCLTQLSVQDNMFNLCNGGNTGVVAGTIATEAGQQVENVAVNMSGNSNASENSDEAGLYSFSDLQFGYDYTITPALDVNYVNGISTFDLVLITKHIIGVAPLNSPYKMIAADVNNSGSISTLDLILLRRLILSIDTEFEQNSSWRFVDRAYEFPDPTNPWLEEFPEVININDMSSSMIAQDFVAVKVGDVNLNANTSNLFDIEDRNLEGNFRIHVEERQMQKGQTIEVVFEAPQIKAVEGFQFTLEFDKAHLDLQDISYGEVGKDDFGWRYEEDGQVLVSWNSISATKMEELFRVRFTVLSSGRLSQHLAINSRKISAEAYDTTGIHHAVSLAFDEPQAWSRAVQLYQNQPNPFKDHTQIRFHLPEAAKCQIQVREVNGKVLTEISGWFEAGDNEVRINAEDLGAGGVLYYTLTVDQEIRTKKMIYMK